MMGPMDRLTGKTVKGMGLELGRATFFFHGGLMATVAVQPRRHGEAPRDITLTVTDYDDESEPEDLGHEDCSVCDAARANVDLETLAEAEKLLAGALLGHEDGNLPVHEFRRGEVADLEMALHTIRGLLP